MPSPELLRAQKCLEDCKKFSNNQINPPLWLTALGEADWIAEIHLIKQEEEADASKERRTI
jgi:hypothetical protein